MKLFRFGPLLALLGLLSPAWAQEPLVIASGGTVTVPAPTANGKVRLQLRVGSATADDESANVQGGNITTRVEADPGLYQLRVVSNDKVRTPIGKDVPVLIPGIRRDAGVWNFNGSPWVTKGTTAAAIGSAPFLKGLRRDDKSKLPLGISVGGSAPLKWDTLAAPSLQSWLNGTAALVAVDASGRALVGYEVSVGAGDLAGRKRGEIKDAVDRFRAATKTTAPNAALILVIDNRDALEAARQINLAAPFFDAVVLKWSATPAFDSQLWPLKMARRVAEEQPNFDLPIFVDVSGIALSDAQLLEIYQGGAAGFLAAPDQAKPAWVSAWESNVNWLTGAVTLEDAAIWPNSSPDVLRLAHTLRRAGRVPLVGRLPGDTVGNGQSDEGNARSAESLFVTLDANTTLYDIHAIERGALNGGTIYVEGLPSPDLWDELGRATATFIKALPSPKNDTMTLDDPWVWGTMRGRELDVTQVAQVTVKGSLAAKAREERGKAVETQPRAVASLSGDANGFMVCPVGKGRVFLLPHRLRSAPDTQLDFYNAVAGTMQAALGTAVEPTSGKRLPVRMTWRATQNKSSLMGLFNPTNEAMNVPIVARGNDATAVNLLSDTEVATRVRGYESQFTVPVPAHSYLWIALGETKEILNKERTTTTIKAKLK